MDVDYSKLNDEKLEAFVLQMIADKGVVLDEGAKEELKTKLLGELNEKLDEAMINALPEEKVEALNKMLDERGDEATEREIHAVVYSSTPEISAAVDKAMNEFRENYLKEEA